MFYASYGSFIHKLLEQYYKGEISKDEMYMKFLFHFENEVQGERPAPGTVEKYIQSGISYFRDFKPMPFKTLAVEKEVRFDIDGTPFIGYVDYIGENHGIHVIDHKSRDLSPRSHRKKPTKKDELLDTMLRQLYIYAKPVSELYNESPSSLCYNCFRTGMFIQESFDDKAYHDALQWAHDSVEEIKDTEEFPPDVEFFKCKYLCGLNHECCYWEMR